MRQQVQRTPSQKGHVLYNKRCPHPDGIDHLDEGTAMPGTQIPSPDASSHWNMQDDPSVEYGIDIPATGGSPLRPPSIPQNRHGSRQ